MESRRRLSDSKNGAGPSIDGLRRNASEGMPEKHDDVSIDGSIGARSARSSSGNGRSSKVTLSTVDSTDNESRGRVGTRVL